MEFWQTYLLLLPKKCVVFLKKCLHNIIFNKILFCIFLSKKNLRLAFYLANFFKKTLLICRIKQKSSLFVGKVADANYGLEWFSETENALNRSAAKFCFDPCVNFIKIYFEHFFRSITKFIKENFYLYVNVKNKRTHS